MSAEFAVDRDIDGQLRIGGADWRIAALAERQHGVVARKQLLKMGIGKDAIDHRVACGRLRLVHRGVYAVGHRVLTIRGRWLGALLAAGPGASLSHRAAGSLWELMRSEQVELTVPRSGHRRRGIVSHCARLPPDEVTEVDGLRVTTVPRTLMDLAAVLSRSRLERAVNEAEIRHVADPLSLPDLVARHPGQRGIRALKAVLADLGSGTVMRSELEARFRGFLRSSGLPAPLFNASLIGMECDCVWPSQRLVVELDGRVAHGTAAAFERDRARDRALAAAGWRVVRITWRQLHEDAESVAADLERVLLG